MLFAGGNPLIATMHTLNFLRRYADHSTANPTGVVPDPRHTTVLRGNKFTDAKLARPFTNGSRVVFKPESWPSNYEADCELEGKRGKPAVSDADAFCCACDEHPTSHLL